MTTARSHAMPNRLAHFVDTADGMTLAEALAQADARLTAIRPPGLARADAVMAELPALASPAGMERMYALGSELAGSAESLKLPALGRAAYSLCELIDAFRAGAPWRAAAVAVHLDAMRLLRGEGEAGFDPVAAEAMVSGLERMSERLHAPGG